MGSGCSSTRTEAGQWTCTATRSGEASRKRLTQSSADEFWPRWSPDGKEIAFHSFIGGRRQLFVMSADGGSQRQVTDGSGDERGGGWTVDGRTLFYLHDFNLPSAEVRAISRSADGRRGEARTVFRGNSYPPVASPDGRLVAFTSMGVGLCYERVG